MALIIVTWKWGAKYSDEYVSKLLSGLRRNLTAPFRFMVAEPCDEDLPLTKIPGCFARLRMFDPEWQRQSGIGFGDRIVCLDLDVVITRPLEGLFDRHEPFVILQKVNLSNPCPYNGSVMMLRAGSHPEVWRDFSIEAAQLISFYEFPDDQGWLWHKLPNAAGWLCGPYSGIYAFKKRSWPSGTHLPLNARMVCFPGRRDPSEFVHLSWVAKHWQ